MGAVFCTLGSLVTRVVIWLRRDAGIGISKPLVACTVAPVDNHMLNATTVEKMPPANGIASGRIRFLENSSKRMAHAGDSAGPRAASCRAREAITRKLLRSSAGGAGGDTKPSTSANV